MHLIQITKFPVFVCRYLERRHVHPVATSGATACVGGGYMYLFGGHARLGNVNDLYLYLMRRFYLRMQLWMMCPAQGTKQFHGIMTESKYFTGRDFYLFWEILRCVIEFEFVPVIKLTTCTCTIYHAKIILEMLLQ